MKTLNKYILLIAVISVILPCRKIIAQALEPVKTVTVYDRQVDCSENIPVESDSNLRNVFIEDNYTYMRNLECLKNSNFLSDLGITTKYKNMNSGNNTHYILSGTGNKIDMNATYDMEGNLVESLLIMQDIRIPHAIREYVFSGEYVGWVMTGNEKIVKDFDPFQIEYKIIVMNGDEEKVLYFKEYGDTITFLDN